MSCRFIQNHEVKSEYKTLFDYWTLLIFALFALLKNLMTLSGLISLLQPSKLQYAQIKSVGLERSQSSAGSTFVRIKKSHFIIFNHVHCLKSIRLTFIPKYSGARDRYSDSMLKKQFCFIFYFTQVQFLFHFWSFQTTCSVNTEGEFQFNNHY